MSDERLDGPPPSSRTCQACGRRVTAPGYWTCDECQAATIEQIRRRREAERRLPPLEGSRPELDGIEVAS